MAKKKTVKKRTSKRIPNKKATRKKTAKKDAKKPAEVRAAAELAVRIETKPEQTFEQRVMERLEQELKKPGLGEAKGTEEKKFIPERKFIPQRGQYRPQFRGKQLFRERREFQRRDEFKSYGEKQIAEFLKEEKIHFLYEYPLAITDEDKKVRIWYPDFWLPELNIIIEYMGMKGKGDYDKANVRKKKIYTALKIDFIEISPGLLVKGNWKRFIAMKIIDIMRSKGYLYRKMKTLTSKYRIPAEQRAKENVGLEILD